MRVAWLNNSEFHTQFPPKKLNDWREGRTLILVKQVKPSAIARVAWQCRLRSVARHCGSIASRRIGGRPLCEFYLAYELGNKPSGRLLVLHFLVERLLMGAQRPHRSIERLQRRTGKIDARPRRRRYPNWRERSVSRNGDRSRHRVQRISTGQLRCAGRYGARCDDRANPLLP